MSIGNMISVISIILAILTAALTLVLGYVGYVTYNLQRRVKDEVDETIKPYVEIIEKQLECRLILMDILAETLAKTMTRLKFDGPERTQVYALEHIARLTSDDEDEVHKALLALEGLGHEITHLLPFVERIRGVTKWSSKNLETYNSLLRKARQRYLGKFQEK